MVAPPRSALSAELDGGWRIQSSQTIFSSTARTVKGLNASRYGCICVFQSRCTSINSIWSTAISALLLKLLCQYNETFLSVKKLGRVRCPLRVNVSGVASIAYFIAAVAFRLQEPPIVSPQFLRSNNRLPPFLPYRLNNL